MVDAPITCKLLSHSMACHPPTVSKKKKISETGPNWAEDKSAEFCQSCGFQFNFLIRRHHCRHCGLLFCRYCAQVCRALRNSLHLSMALYPLCLRAVGRA